MTRSMSRSRSHPATEASPRRRFRRLCWVVAAAFVLGVALVALPRLFFYAAYRDAIHSADGVPPAPVAIVFGAGIWTDGSATPVLYDRVATAAELYREGRVARLLLSGDGRTADHDEPAAMRSVAISLGVPESAILLDRQGVRTYESCSRARDIHGVEQAVLVTQEFHLPRAMYLCDQLGVTVTGVPARGHRFSWQLRAGWQAREVLASAGAWWDINMLRP